MMKIAHFLGGLDFGGTETLILDSFRSIQKQSPGFEVICIYRRNGQLSDEFKKTGINLHHMARPRLFGIRYLLKLRKLLIAQKIDIIHAHLLMESLLARIACINTNIKVILTFHGYNSTHNVISRIMTKIALRVVDLNIFVSNHQKKYYQTHFDSKRQDSQAVVYNGVLFEKLKKSNHDKTIRNSLNISDNTLLIGSVGNFVKGRDQMTICRFLYQLNKSGLDFIFLFVGGKHEKEPWRFDDCVAYCQKHGLLESVHFLGFRNDVPAILNQLDAYVYSTDHDSFGIALIEAISLGIPVFVNDWEVMSEITLKGRFAVLYRTRDDKDLFNKFMAFESNRDKFLQTAAISAENVKNRYGIRIHLLKLKLCYEGVINQ
jgi:glycosyltransferase involved in cell wall biosynthesis